MAVEHIESLEVINFKCFKHLIVSDIGKVNLIGGKNNVGKTAFLEAAELLVCSFNSTTGFRGIHTIYKILKRRQNHNNTKNFDIDFIFAGESKMKISSPSVKDNIFSRSIELEINDINITSSIRYNNNIDNITLSQTNLIKDNDVFDNINSDNSLIYIYPSKINEQDIAFYFGTIAELSLESFLNESLSLFDNNIIELKLIPTERGVALKLKLKDKKHLVLLSSLGEGINRYIAILCAIWASKDGVLLIDEIENGIHYTNYKKLWEIIFKTSVEANCQLFITTHSKECIMAFNEAQFEYENSNASYIELYKNKKKDDLITAAVHDKQQLRYELTHEGKVRGE